MRAHAVAACILVASIYQASGAAALTRTPSRTPTRTPTSNRPLPVPLVTILPSPARSGETVTLDASASGGAISGYEWKQTAGDVAIEIEDRFSPVASFVAPQVEEATVVKIEIGLSAFNPTVVRKTFEVTIVPAGTPGFTVSGTVAEFPSGCFGAMRGFTVTLLPLGLMTQTDLSIGGFTFQDVPPGDYTLTVGPACNPFGCWPPTGASVVDADVSVRICPVAATPTSPAISTPTSTATPTPTNTPIVPLTGTPDLGPPCAGDCDADGSVSTGEVVRAVRSTLEGGAPPCSSVDTNGNGFVDILELVRAVRWAIEGCA